MISIRKITVLLTIFFLSGFVAFGQMQQQMQQGQPQQQADVSDSEVKQFAEAFQEVQKVDQKAQQDITTAVEKEELDMQRFNEIYQAQQDPNNEADVSGDEMQKFEKSIEKIQTIQTQAQEVMVKKIEDVGLTIQRYQELATLIQQDPELIQKVQEYIEKG